MNFIERALMECLGLNYWVAERRGYEPEIQKHKNEVEFVRECERED